jgi:putative transposase
MREHLNRQGIRVAKCTVERLMRACGWRAVTGTRTVRTTVEDPAHSRALDLVQRNFTAQRSWRIGCGGRMRRRAR